MRRYLRTGLNKLCAGAEALCKTPHQPTRTSHPFLRSYGAAASSLPPIRREMLLGRKDTQVLVIDPLIQNKISEDPDNLINRCKEHSDGSLICYSSNHFSPRKLQNASANIESILYSAANQLDVTPGCRVPIDVVSRLPKDIRSRQSRRYCRIPVLGTGLIDVSSKSYPCMGGYPSQYLDTSRWKRWLSAINLSRAFTGILAHTEGPKFILKSPHFLIVSPLCLDPE